MSLKLVRWDLVDYISVLDHIKAWHQTGDKPLSDPTMNQFTDAYMHHPTALGQKGYRRLQRKWHQSVQFKWCIQWNISCLKISRICPIFKCSKGTCKIKWYCPFSSKVNMHLKADMKQDNDTMKVSTPILLFAVVELIKTSIIMLNACKFEFHY